MAAAGEETVHELVRRAADGDMGALSIIVDRLGHGNRLAGLSVLMEMLRVEYRRRDNENGTDGEQTAEHDGISA